jgi:GNAT superfamily N-acetyltransferase
VTEPRTPRLRISDARPGELDQVSRVIAAAYQEYAPLFPSAVWEAYVQEITDVRGRMGASELIVAKRGGRIAGTVTVYPMGSNSEQEGWPAGWAGIRLLAVHPQWRRLGIGRVLLEECLRRCRERGISTVALHTTEAMGVARGMYERMGFVRVPAFDFHPGPRAVVMAYRLDL